ncbi:hypothetical protein [Halomicrobium katesii]|uniref:hypothetical protein n=1 Tax=Halomicrobium katesii TaxID=437163 RepID=UPI0003790BD0|nr:hypothetical protein [Halomicrobium katesii]
MSADELTGLPERPPLSDWVALSPTEEAAFLAVAQLLQPDFFPWGGGIIDYADEHYHSMSERQGYRALTNLTEKDLIVELDPEGRIDYYDVTDEGEQLLHVVRDELQILLE